MLLVEGNDDKHVMWSLLEFHKVPETFRVSDNDGIDNLIKNLPVHLKGSEVSAVGVVIDADLNASSRWDALKTVLAKAGYTSVPKLPESNGTIIEEKGLPKFGAWVMPDNSLPGMLEDFVSYLVPDGDELWKKSSQAVENIPEQERKFIEAHSMKAKIHTWLAWQEDPGTPMGLAITKKYLNADAKSVIPFLSWLAGIFAQPA